MDPIIIIVAAACALVLFVQVNARWRSGMFFIVLTGFAQDVARKLTPGEPVATSALVGVVMLLVFAIGLRQIGGHSTAMNLRLNYPQIFRAFVIFSGVVFFKALVTLVNFGSIPLAGIGLIAYLSPLPAVWVGWWFCQTQREYRDLGLVYLGCALLVALSVYATWMGVDWKIFQHVGEVIVFYGDRGIITMHTGLMRTPEVTAWHMGAATCFVIILAVQRPSPARFGACLLAIAVLIPAIYLTGRRKALALIALFMGILIVLVHFSRHRDARKAGFALIGVAVGVFGIFLFLSEDLSDSSAFQAYSERGGSTFDDALDRFYSLGLASAGWAIDQVGFLGLGAGAVSQGSQHFGVDAEMTGAAEGGLGKIIVELGIPGLIVSAWLLWVLARVIRRLLAHTDRVGSGASIMARALVAFLAANIFIFITASQIFGDPFVLICLGIALGALLATPRLKNLPRRREVLASSQMSDIGGSSARGQAPQFRS